MLLVVFQVGDQRYALHLEVVERVVRAVEVSVLAGAPKGVVGVVNVFGRILPVLDPRGPLGVPEKAMAITDQFIISYLPGQAVVLWVDSVDGVIDYPEGEVTQAKEILAGIGGVEGVAKLEQGIVFIEELSKLYGRMAGRLEALDS